MIKKNKISISLTVALMVMVLSVIPTLTSYAAFTQQAKIIGNGVRLRRSPGNGTIIGLMYYGEKILIDDKAYDPNYSAWIYVKRESNNTRGWMEWSYFEHE